jgi:hypothetical protein
MACNFSAAASSSIYIFLSYFSHHPQGALLPSVSCSYEINLLYLIMGFSCKDYKNYISELVHASKVLMKFILADKDACY